jgi:hypothetical protein
MWTETSAPAQQWTGIASSADGSRLTAVFNDDAFGNCSGIFVSTNSGATSNQANIQSNFGHHIVSSPDGVELYQPL